MRTRLTASRATRRILLAAATVVAMVVGVGSVYAGLKLDENVAITVSGANSTAVGAVGSVRATADNVQFIRCTIQGLAASNNVFCSARNIAGTQSFSCTANNNVTLARAVAGISGNSRLFLAATSGVCTQIDSTNGSVNRPAIP
jgi:hypothetical protein